MAIEVAISGFKEIDAILKRANYTKVLHMIRNLDNIYVHNDWRSAFFGADQKPRLMENMSLYLRNMNWKLCLYHDVNKMTFLNEETI